MSLVTFLLLFHYLCARVYRPISRIFSCYRICWFEALAYFLVFKGLLPRKVSIMVAVKFQRMWAEACKLILLSLPYVLTAGLVTINLEVDKIIVGFMLPVSDLPSYFIAARVMLLMHASLLPYESVLSRNSILKGADQNSLFVSIRRTYTISFYLSLLFAFVMLFFSPLVHYLYGSSFDSGILLCASELCSRIYLVNVTIPSHWLQRTTKA